MSFNKNLKWSESEYQKYMQRFDRSTVRAADMESDVAHDGERADRANEKTARVRIHVHSRRRRLADPDGVCAKAVIDGIRAGGFMPDDSAKYVESVTYSQELWPWEETIVTLEWSNTDENR